MLDEEISYDALARRCQLDTCDLRRLLRLAMSFHVFHERQDGLVTHTAMSRALVEIPGLHDWMGLVCEDMHPASIRSIDAMEKWPGSGDPAHTGFALAEGIDCGFYDILGRDPLRASRFAKGMMLNNSAPALHPVLLADNLPWTTADCPKSVIDIGGSHGTVGSEILRRYPQIQEYVVQDLSDISGDRNGQDDSADRITYQQYDYFTEQTVKGADIYLLRLVLHNWSDEKAIEILKNQVAAMEPHSRIVLNEICLPKPGILPYYQEQFLRLSLLTYLP